MLRRALFPPSPSHSDLLLFHVGMLGAMFREVAEVHKSDVRVQGLSIPNRPGFGCDHIKSTEMRDSETTRGAHVMKVPRFPGNAVSSFEGFFICGR